LRLYWADTSGIYPPPDQPSGLGRGFAFCLFDRALYDRCIDLIDYRKGLKQRSNGDTTRGNLR